VRQGAGYVSGVLEGEPRLSSGCWGGCRGFEIISAWDDTATPYAACSFFPKGPKPSASSASTWAAAPPAFHFRNAALTDLLTDTCRLPTPRCATPTAPREAPCPPAMPLGPATRAQHPQRRRAGIRFRGQLYPQNRRPSAARRWPKASNPALRHVFPLRSGDACSSFPPRQSVPPVAAALVPCGPPADRTPPEAPVSVPLGGPGPSPSTTPAGAVRGRGRVHEFRCGCPLPLHHRAPRPTTVRDASFFSAATPAHIPSPPAPRAMVIPAVRMLQPRLGTPPAPWPRCPPNRPSACWTPLTKPSGPTPVARWCCAFSPTEPSTIATSTKHPGRAVRPTRPAPHLVIPVH